MSAPESQSETSERDTEESNVPSDQDPENIEELEALIVQVQAKLVSAKKKVLKQKLKGLKQRRIWSNTNANVKVQAAAASTAVRQQKKTNRTKQFRRGICKSLRTCHRPWKNA